MSAWHLVRLYAMQHGPAWATMRHVPCPWSEGWGNWHNIERACNPQELAAAVAWYAAAVSIADYQRHELPAWARDRYGPLLAPLLVLEALEGAPRGGRWGEACIVAHILATRTKLKE